MSRKTINLKNRNELERIHRRQMAEKLGKDFDLAERAWAAGFFDADGSVSLSSTGFNCSLEQVSDEVAHLERFCAAVRAGKISNRKHRQRGKERPTSVWTVTNQVDLNRVFDRIGPFLSAMKRRNFEEALNLGNARQLQKGEFEELPSVEVLPGRPRGKAKKA